jgi:membrane protease subunit HflK
MPWNNQSGGGGGWKSGGGNNGGPWGQGPWGQGGGGGGGGQPDLEDILKRSQDKMKQVMHGGGGLPGPLVFLAAILAAAAVAWYAFFFRVNPDELGVVMRFGQFVRQEPPGLHFRLPYPIEEVRLPKVTVQQTIEIGMRGGSRTGSSEGSLMLTGDGNVVDVRFVVYWRIKPEAVGDYLFNIQNPEITVREVAESAMREVVGQSNLQPLLTEGRAKAQADVQKLMQSILDYYGAGVRIDQVQLREVDPPAQVISAFRDVQSAGQDKDRYIKEAQTYADQVVPRAKGEADRILAAAQGYKDQTVAEAVGQTARFLKVYEEYKKAPDVTRERLFLEMQEKVLTGTDKIILDGKNGGSGVVPYLPLDQLQKKPATTTEGGN